MAGSKWAKGQNGPRVEMGQGSKWAKGRNGPRVKMGQESKWANSQSKPRVHMGCCCLPPERVKLSLTSKKETNGGVKLDQESM